MLSGRLKTRGDQPKHWALPSIQIQQKKAQERSDDSLSCIRMQACQRRNTTVQELADKWMEGLATAFKLKTAGFMASHFRSRSILNAIFVSFFALVVMPLIVNGSEAESALLAIIPSAVATMILWFTFINKYVNWIMQKSTSSPYGIENFRTIGFILFLCGGYYHCIDFLGTEKTSLWVMGMTFLALMLVSIGLWIRYALRKRFWTFFI